MQAPSPVEVATARRIMVWNDFIPQPVRFPLMLLIIVIFMFSGGVYMSAVAEMTGSLAWNNEDILMAGYASMTGLTIAFPLLFRILYAFSTREFLLLSTGIFILCDYLCMVSEFLPLVVLLSFISGFFKIAGTFVCWNNIQLRITAKRDFAIFFPFLFTFVLGSVQLANIATGYSIYAFDWKAMHRITIGAFFLVFLLIFFGMRKRFHQEPASPSRVSTTWAAYFGAFGFSALSLSASTENTMTGLPAARFRQPSSSPSSCCYSASTERPPSGIPT